jgi:hypothetical protein
MVEIQKTNLQKTNQQSAMKNPQEASFLKVALGRPAPMSAVKKGRVERNSAELPPTPETRKSTSSAQNPVARLELEHAHEEYRRSKKQEEKKAIIDTFRQLSTIIYSNKMATTRASYYYYTTCTKEHNK